MIPLHNALSIVGDSGKTYPDFVARLGSLTGATRSWGSSFNSTPTNAYRVVTNPTVSGSMEGSSWASWLWDGSTVCRAIQHAMPDVTTFNEVKDASREVLLNVENIGSDQTTWISRNRNGYVSSASEGAGYISIIINSMLYWAEGRAWIITPYMTSIPQPYNW